jgi:putative sigma-54 modulation protein
MNIQINAVGFNASSKLETFVNDKVKKLMQFYDDIIGAEIFLKQTNTTDPENKVAEIRLEIPGNDLFVKKQSKTFEQSTDSACDALRRQISKHKEKYKRA